MIQLAALFITIAVAFAGIAWYTYDRSSSLVTEGLPADATVVKLEYSGVGSGADGVYHPVIAFDTRSGQHVEIRSEYGEYPSRYRQGQQIKVLYRQDNPRTFQINSWYELYILPVIFGSLSAVLVVVTIIVWILNRIARAKNWQQAMRSGLNSDSKL